MAFRSVPRPSSPPGAKASTERPSLALSYATFEAKPRTSHLAQEPSNPSFNVQDLSPSGLPSNSFDGVPPMPSHPRKLREQPPDRDGRAIKHIHSLHASEHCPVAGTWIALTILLRSDLQPARPDAPNPDSHVKRTKDQTFQRRPSPHPYDHRPATSQEAPLNAHTICFPTATASLLPEQSSLWRWTVSNRRPPACKAGALPLSYTPRRHKRNERKQLFLVRKSQRTFIT